MEPSDPNPCLEVVMRQVMAKRRELQHRLSSSFRIVVGDLVRGEAMVPEDKEQACIQLARSVAGPAFALDPRVRVLVRLEQWCRANQVVWQPVHEADKMDLIFGPPHNFFRDAVTAAPVIDRIRQAVQRGLSEGALNHPPNVLYLESQAQHDLGQTEEMRQQRMQARWGAAYPPERWEGMVIRPLGAGNGVAVAYES